MTPEEWWDQASYSLVLLGKAVLFKDLKGMEKVHERLEDLLRHPLATGEKE